MPFNGSGVFGRVMNWVSDATNSIPMTPSRFDADANDMADGLSQCLTRNGQSVPTANLPMGGFQITGLAAGVNPTDAVNVAQLTSFNVLIGDGVTDKSALLAAAVAVGYPIQIRGILVINTPVTITVPIVDTIAQIFSTASQVTIANGLPVRPEWWGIGNQNTIALAVAALPATITNGQIGGEVRLRNAIYLPNNFVYGFAGSGKNISTDNVRLLGAGMPQVSTDCKNLVAGTGTIIQGPLFAFANNITIRDLGVDSGFNVCTTYNGGAPTAGSYGEGMELTYPNDAVKAAAGVKYGAVLENIICLSFSPTSPTHACILAEGYKGVSYRNITAIYGTHGIAVKAQNVRGDLLAAYLNSSDGIIIKTDLQATAIATDQQHGKMRVVASGPDGTAPYVAAPGTGVGLLFHASGGSIDKIQIGQVEAIGYPINIGTSYGGAYSISSVTIDDVISDQQGVAGTPTGVQVFANASQNVYRFRINKLEGRNCAQPLQCVFPQTSTNLANRVSVGDLIAVNAANALDLGNQAYLDIESVATDNLSDAVYHITGTPKLTVGMLNKDTATPAVYSTLNSGLAPALSNGWTQVASNDTFGVDLVGGKVAMRGLIKPGTTNVPMTLPRWAWPASNKRDIVQGYNGTTQVSVPINVSASGVVTVNEAAGGFANCTSWLSLTGFSWDQQA